MQLTFNDLPAAVSQLFNKVSDIEQLLIQKCIEPQTNADCWFDLNELCNYLPDKPAKATAYGWIHAGSLPCHKGQKKLRFLKSEIDQWLLSGKKKTVSEIEAEAHSYLIKQKRRRIGAGK